MKEALNCKSFKIFKLLDFQGELILSIISSVSSFSLNCIAKRSIYSGDRNFTIEGKLFGSYSVIFSINLKNSRSTCLKFCCKVTFNFIRICFGCESCSNRSVVTGGGIVELDRYIYIYWLNAIGTLVECNRYAG